jgi:hypothetical protein
MNSFEMPKQIVVPADHLIAPHLRLSEIRCPCGCQYGMYSDEFDQRNAENHEIIRQAAGGVPLHVGSGCRCPAKNRSLWPIGAHPNSDHMRGRGMDLSVVEGMTPLDFAVLVLELYDSGKLADVTAIGFYEWGVHLSVGSMSGRLHIWGPIKDETTAKWESRKPKPQSAKKPAKKAAKKGK